MAFVERGGSRRAAAVLAVWVLVASLCSCSLLDDDEPSGAGATSSSGGTTAELGDTEVSVATDAPVSITPSPVSEEEATELESVVGPDGIGGLVGPTLEIRVDGTVPDSGVRLTRHYPTPLPDDAAATFVYHDPELGTWVAVPSRLSADRSTLTATVSHLSVWTDLVSGTQDAMSSVADAFAAAGAAIHDGIQEGLHAVAAGAEWAAGWVYYAVGKIFDTRVDAPTCSGPLPTWMDSTTQIEDDKNNPIRWCAGHDVQHPELLVVKARVNRGFGFPYATAAKPRWRHNGTFDQATSLALDALVDQDQFWAKTVELLGLGPLAVGRGGELSLGFSEAKVRAVEVGQPLVTLSSPSPVAFLASVTAGLVGQAAKDSLGGWIGTVVSLGSCVRSLNDVDDALDAARAALNCVGLADEAIARKIAVTLLKTKPGITPQAAGKQAGGLVGRVSIYLALVGPVFSSLNYVAELNTAASARTLTAFPTTVGATDVVTINPFGPDGSLLPGYTLDDQRTEVTGAPEVDCTYDDGAIAGTTPNTHWCGTTADSADECWAPPQYADDVVCMFAPWDPGLVRRSTVGLHPTATPANPQPFGLELADGSMWRVRIGGSWGARADDYVGAYSCQAGPCPEGEVVLLTDPDHPAVDMSGTTWYVLQGELGDPGETFPPPDRLPVVRAWFIASSF